MRISNVRKITKFKRSIKAISPVIATLLMIAIAVVASLVVYAWVTGYMGNTTSKAGKAIQIQSFALANDGLHVYVQNVGQGAVELSTIYVDSNLKTFTPDPNYPDNVLEEGKTADLLVAGTYGENAKLNIKITTTDGTFMTRTGTVPSSSNTTPSGGNASPVIDTATPTSPVSVASGGSQQFTVTAHDPDAGDTLTYTWYLDSVQQASTTSSYTYSSASGTTHTVRVDISDGKVTTPTSQSWSVTVTTSPQQIVLRPNASGDNQLSRNTGSNNYQAVDEDPSDDATTYVYDSTGADGYDRDYYGFTDHGSVTGTINSVTVYIDCRQVLSGGSTTQSHARTVLRYNSNNNYGTDINLGSTWTVYQTAYTTRPGGGSWTWADIDALQAGVSLDSADLSGTSQSQAQATQVYVIVTYTP